MSKSCIVVFAQVPPPEHGQSRMIALMLEGFRKVAPGWDVHHVDARFSDTLEDIGGTSWSKFARSARYVVQALRLRFRHRPELLYYVPGPVRWSAVMRDWLILGILRPFYPKVAFHWHAIGQGEWAHGSPRLRLTKADWIDRIARRISARVLREPSLSIILTDHSAKDAAAVSSWQTRLVCNGIADPCAGFAGTIESLRRGRARDLATSPRPRFKVLFLSVGTVEKGLIDLVETVGLFLAEAPPAWGVDLTIAGGVQRSCQQEFESRLDEIKTQHGDRLSVVLKGYVSGAEKSRCLIEQDVFVAPSRWESFGLTVAEAMAHGLVVVGAASDGVQGVLPEGYPYLSPVAEPAGLARNLRACCESILDGGGSDMGLRLRQTFLDRYQLEAFFLNVTGALQGLVCPEGAAAFVPTRPIRLSIYLADQNPKLGRSLGISRMTQVLLGELATRKSLILRGITSRSSIQMPAGSQSSVVPWNTRSRLSRVVTDHLHPLLHLRKQPDLWYFPKGFLPRIHRACSPSVVTIHDTIIQYYSDHYPDWRTDMEYRYWASMLRHTLRHADAILTISESAKEQIQVFMERHRIPAKQITVTYEPCLYEDVPQPLSPSKADYVLHLGSREPHKRTAWLLRLWATADQKIPGLPKLHVVGKVPEEVVHLSRHCPRIVQLPFLDDRALRSQFEAARALVFPSEIEGFGLPAVEAYYLGTPVCYTAGTSIEEVLGTAGKEGGFSLDDPASLFRALEEVLALSEEEIFARGMMLREKYAAGVVVDKMVATFRHAAGKC